jgi:hypothetical protein
MACFVIELSAFVFNLIIIKGDITKQIVNIVMTIPWVKCL